MATLEQLRADLHQAMRARDQARLRALRGLVAALKNLEVEKRGTPLGEEDVGSVVRKEVQKRREAIEYAERAGRTDLVDENRAELAVLEEYLPRQLSREELARAIQSLAEELGTKEIGPLMRELRSRFPNQYDGRLASEIIRGL